MNEMYDIRKAILEKLFKMYKKSSFNTHIPSDDIAEELKIAPDKVERECDYLTKKGLIDTVAFGTYQITEFGVDAVMDEDEYKESWVPSINIVSVSNPTNSPISVGNVQNINFNDNELYLALSEAIEESSLTSEEKKSLTKKIGDLFLNQTTAGILWEGIKIYLKSKFPTVSL